MPKHSAYAPAWQVSLAVSSGWLEAEASVYPSNVPADLNSVTACAAGDLGAGGGLSLSAGAVPEEFHSNTIVGINLSVVSPNGVNRMTAAVEMNPVDLAAYVANDPIPVVAAGPDDGTDLTLSNGEITSTAGGIFIVHFILSAFPAS